MSSKYKYDKGGGGYWYYDYGNGKTRKLSVDSDGNSVIKNSNGTYTILQQNGSAFTENPNDITVSPNMTPLQTAIKLGYVHDGNVYRSDTTNDRKTYPNVPDYFSVENYKNNSTYFDLKSQYAHLKNSYLPLFSHSRTTKQQLEELEKKTK